MILQVEKLIEKSSKKVVQRAELKLPLVRIKVISINWSMTVKNHFYIRGHFLLFSISICRKFDLQFMIL